VDSEHGAKCRKTFYDLLIYTILDCFTFGIALIGLLMAVSQRKLQQNTLVISIVAVFGFWWLKTGPGLLRLRRGIKFHAFIVAAGLRRMK
jgi:hypothetical protein